VTTYFALDGSRAARLVIKLFSHRNNVD